MFDRMPAKKLTAAKGGSSTANHLADLATKANGHGVTRVDKERAQAALEAAVGSRKAKRLKDDAIKSARRSVFG
jgi:hypothetical protein